MSNTVLISGCFAIILFWGVGAYNRLIRLRAVAIAAFAPLQLQYGQYAALVQSNFELEIGEDRSTARTGLINAALQFEASLKAANARPLDSLVMRAFDTAHQVLQASWVKVCEDPQDLAGAPWPGDLQKQWLAISWPAERGRDEFNRRIHDYNQGIQQFPANLLAWLFRFKPAYWDKETS
jgi:LemA protein